MTAQPFQTPLSLLRLARSTERKSALEVSFAIIRMNVFSNVIFYIFFFKQTCFPVFIKLDIFLLKFYFPLQVYILLSSKIAAYFLLLDSQSFQFFLNNSNYWHFYQRKFVSTWHCTAGTCDGGIFTFEKTTGHFLRTGRETALELSSNTPGITKECVLLCLGKGKEWSEIFFRKSPTQQ